MGLKLKPKVVPKKSRIVKAKKQVLSDNPFSKLLMKEMDSRIKKDYLVREYEIQQLLAEGLREILNPSAHAKNTKEGHRDMRQNGSVQSMGILWNKIKASIPVQGDPFKRKVVVPKGHKHNQSAKKVAKKAE